ncbi:10028_t:CDS:2 [Funneliformis geosporum]|uniref:16234_t:CDS:1 n=1 Tax=Funneliformis geosporum TaxID=1117311 RepID=A0A9W4SFX1_9GLOM|nr:10028_t:CDS:2 [Funneliformis geosporum]CAI2167560.1 16234_t:CDS:2 [Funneliformis geosporum]
MFDTPAAAFYHGPSQKNVKSLFSSINMPSTLPTQFLPSSLTNLSFSGYFQQPSQQEAKISSIEPSSIVASAPTAPQQPTHNKRTQRRVPKQQNSSSIVATAPQRLVVANNNMGNVSSVTAQSSSSSSTPNAAPSSHHQHHAPSHVTSRRKKHSNKINRKKVDDAITLSAFAVEEDNQGNHDVAMEFYLTAIENMLEALPIHANQSRRDALKNKLRDFMDRSGLTDDFMESTNAFSAAKTVECEEPQSSNGANISQHIIQAAITSAVALKQSPIPDAITATMNYTMKKIQKIDETYGLQDKAWEISRTGINLALEIDQQYNVHEKVGNAFFVGLAAAMKATIAYKDSPSYRELRRIKDEFQNATSSSFNCKEETAIMSNMPVHRGIPP